MDGQSLQHTQAHTESDDAASRSNLRLGNWSRSRLYIALAILLTSTLLALALLPSINTLVGPSQEHLIEQRARYIGSRALERMNAADTVVRLISFDIERHGATKKLWSSVSLDAFSSINLLQAGKPAFAIKGSPPTPQRLDPAAIVHIESGRTALITSQASISKGPTLVRAVEIADSPEPGLLFAELKSEHLWQGPAHKNSVAHLLCVRDSAGHSIFCDQSINAPATNSARQEHTLVQNQAALERVASHQQPIGQSSVPIAVRFGGNNWIVSVSEPQSATGISSVPLKIIYVTAGMVCVLVSIALASLLTRPATNTETGKMQALRVARGTNSNPGAIPGRLRNDPDRETAKTAEHFAAVLKLFAEIDRAILSGATFERIATSVFPRIRAVLPTDATALALLDDVDPDNSKMMIAGPDDHREDCLIEGALDARSTARLTSIPDGDWLDSEPEDALLAPLHKLGMSRCLVFPVYKEANAVGALIVATRNAIPVDKQLHALARDIAHRLGVAYTSAVRGQQLLFHSLYDSTTELPNRRYFEKRLAEEISRAHREARQVALLLVDLDDFKKVNDVFGHEGGDILLEHASERLKVCLRTEDLVARIGSDEFGILLPTIGSRNDAAAVAQKLIEALSESYTLGGREHHMSATIGVAVFPDDGRNANALLRSADFAMHAAKRDGGATYSTYEPQSNEQAQDRAALAVDLRQAITKSELTLYFQPQIDLRRGEIVGAEALVRWQHRTRGMVMPGAFINIAEQSDLIEQVGEFVRHEASTQFREWERHGMAPLRISVNVSSREFKQRDFVERIEDTLISSGLRPFSLELEITESLLVESSDQVLSALKALSHRGVRIAIDDFGTGYSSMAYLKTIPFNVLKIDRTFIKDIGTQDGSDSIVNAIIGVAQGLGKEIVAEGIETEAQRAFLADNDCDMGQGYLWSRPVPADDFVAYVRHWNEAARRVATIE